MSVTYQLEIPVESKDLRDAIAAYLAAWRQALPGSTTAVDILLQTTHWEPLRLFAERLPRESRGFRRLSGENLTAEDTLRTARAAGRGAMSPDLSYSGEIVPLLAENDLVALLGEFSALAPGPLRRSALTLTANGLRWRGAEEGAQGTLALFDAKAFGWKNRFRLTAAVAFDDGVDAASRERQLARIADSSGLDFRRGDARRAGPSPQSTPAELAFACLLFDHCVEAVSQSLLQDGFDWRTLSGACANGEGAARRFAAYGRAPAEKIRLGTRLDRFTKTHFPGLEKRKDVFADAHAYFETLDPDWDLAVLFDTHPGRGIGRVFKLRVGLAARGGRYASFQRTAPMLRCAGGGYSEHVDACPELTFDTEDELDQVLAALRGFLLDFRARFVARFRDAFLPGLEHPASALPVQGELSCREALDLARAHLASTGAGYLDLHAARLCGSVDNLHYRRDRAAQLPASGRLTPWHGWDFDFIEHGSRLTVSVPYAGLLRVSRWDSYLLSGQPRAALAPLPGSWVDSSQVAGSFLAAFAGFAPRYPEMEGVAGLASLRQEADGPAWTCPFELSSRQGKGGWVLIVHAIDARDGSTRSTTFDERFPDRPQTRRVTIEGPHPPGGSAVEPTETPR